MAVSVYGRRIFCRDWFRRPVNENALTVEDASRLVLGREAKPIALHTRFGRGCPTSLLLHSPPLEMYVYISHNGVAKSPIACCTLRHSGLYMR